MLRDPKIGEGNLPAKRGRAENAPLDLFLPDTNYLSVFARQGIGGLD
jgi:hypothetical protein